MLLVWRIRTLFTYLPFASPPFVLNNDIHWDQIDKKFRLGPQGQQGPLLRIPIGQLGQDVIDRQIQTWRAASASSPQPATLGITCVEGRI